MQKTFTWERGPFDRCPSCRKDAFGILSTGGDRITLRCSECRYSHSETLPELDKQVIYLDQSIFSLLFQVEGGGRLPPGHEDFAQQLHHKLRRVVLRQQAVLPHSDIHHEETTVFHSASDLRLAYERLGGDVELIDTRDVEQAQMASYAKAFIGKHAPALGFGVDEVLSDKRNRWLDDIHVHVTANYQMFAEATRQRRDRAHDEMQNMVQLWQSQRPSFDELLRRQLHSFFNRPQALLRAIQSFERIAEGGDGLALLDASPHPLLEEHQMLHSIFLRAGVPEKDLVRKIVEFWQWEVNLTQPHHRISSYMFAAIGRRIVNGQRRVNRGMMNDVRAIATYAPYVDAMFVDQECASLLGENRLKDELQYKARIFSFANRDEFLEYLDELDQRTPLDVSLAATRIYGVSA